MDDVADAVTEEVIEPEIQDEPPIEEIPAEEPEDSPTLADDDVDGEQPTDSAETPVEDAQPIPETPTFEPYSFKVDGESVAIEGVVRSQGFVMIPEEVFQKQLQPKYLASRDSWRKREEHYRRQLEERDPAKNPDVLRAQKLSEGLTQLMALEDDDEFVNRAYQLKQQWPVLQAKAEAAIARAEADRLRNQTQTVDVEQQRAEWLPRLEAALEEAVNGAVKQYDGLDLDPKSIKTALWRLQDKAFMVAPKDIPEWGVREGELTVRWDLVQEAVERDAAVARRYQTKLEEAQRAREEASRAAAKNEKALQKLKPATTVSAHGSPAVGGKSGRTKEEYARYMRDTYGVVV